MQEVVVVVGRDWLCQGKVAQALMQPSQDHFTFRLTDPALHQRYPVLDKYCPRLQ